ncbi:MAG: hypothetical protein ACE5IR_26730, partial [bacterium]
HSGEPQGSAVVIRQPGTIEVVRDNGTTGQVENTIEDLWEHEMSHVIDNADGISRLEGGPVHIDASGEWVPLRPGEGRAVNRANDYRQKKNRGYQRRKY